MHHVHVYLCIYTYIERTLLYNTVIKHVHSAQENLSKPWIFCRACVSFVLQLFDLFGSPQLAASAARCFAQVLMDREEVLNVKCCAIVRVSTESAPVLMVFDVFYKGGITQTSVLALEVACYTLTHVQYLSSKKCTYAYNLCILCIPAIMCTIAMAF